MKVLVCFIYFKDLLCVWLIGTESNHLLIKSQSFYGNKFYSASSSLLPNLPIRFWRCHDLWQLGVWGSTVWTLKHYHPVKHSCKPAVNNLWLWVNNLWLSVKIFDFLWKSLTFCENLWLSVKIFDLLWTIFDFLWTIFDFLGTIFDFLGTIFDFLPML